MLLAAEFGRKVGLVRSAHASASRVAALGHEAVDHAVEDDVVVKAFLGEFADARDMAGREIGTRPDDDVAAAVEIEDQGVQFVGHGRLHCCFPGALGAAGRIGQPGGWQLDTGDPLA